MYHFYEKYEMVDIYKVIDRNENVTFEFRYGGHTYSRKILRDVYDLIKQLRKGDCSK